MTISTDVTENRVLLKHEAITEKVIGVFFDVYNELGYGFLESVYEECMVLALSAAGLHVERQYPIPVWFRGNKVADFRADLVIEHSVLVELKAVKSLDPAHEKQVRNYLRATDLEVGLLFNFGQRPEFRRVVFENVRKIRGNPHNPRESASKGF